MLIRVKCPEIACGLAMTNLERVGRPRRLLQMSKIDRLIETEALLMGFWKKHYSAVAL